MKKKETYAVRGIEAHVRQDLDRKMILLSGPRQAGKTTFSKNLFNFFQYLNYDSAKDRLMIRNEHWDRSVELLILDELHKMKNWKTWLKGIWDTRGQDEPRMLVTGSARLEVSRRTGDSLAGRFFHYRLYPFSVAELVKNKDMPSDPSLIVKKFLEISNFPEPYSIGSSGFYEKWRRSHLELILRQDAPVIEQVKDVVALEVLVNLLRTRVGSTVSYASLARDLERDASTVKRWIQILESLYVIFRVTPYSRSIARSLLKEPKFYFYDLGQVEGDLGAKFENLVALALLTEQHRRQDTEGAPASTLHFLKNKQGMELDFAWVDKKGIQLIVEAKVSDGQISRNFETLAGHIPSKKVQLVLNPTREYTSREGIEIRNAPHWLAHLPSQGV